MIMFNCGLCYFTILHFINFINLYHMNKQSLRIRKDSKYIMNSKRKQTKSIFINNTYIVYETYCMLSYYNCLNLSMCSQFECVVFLLICKFIIIVNKIFTIKMTNNLFFKFIYLKQIKFN